ncbi:unnamed protein product [Haemonchus placei]|uniref:Uncharacterized protein n=1 Tax=Haemonchus placei TaxID=6290 RepID=A0A0N4X8J0_HAEPC|nr:unnamed protein product [Haemonchus placei]
MSVEPRMARALLYVKWFDRDVRSNHLPCMYGNFVFSLHQRLLH